MATYDYDKLKLLVDKEYKIDYDYTKHTLLDFVDKIKDDEKLLRALLLINKRFYDNYYNINMLYLTITFFKKITKKNDYHDIISDKDNFLKLVLENEEYLKKYTQDDNRVFDINIYYYYILVYYLQINITNFDLSQIDISYDNIISSCISIYISNYKDITFKQFDYLKEFIYTIYREISIYIYNLKKYIEDKENKIIYKIQKQLNWKLNAINDIFIKLVYLYSLLFSYNDFLKLNINHIFNKITIINDKFNFDNYYDKDKLVFVDASGYKYMIKIKDRNKASGVSKFLFDSLNSVLNISIDDIPHYDITKSFLKISDDGKGDIKIITNTNKTYQEAHGDINIYNSKNKQGAYFHRYAREKNDKFINVIHAVGPDFHEDDYKELLGGGTDQKQREKKCKELLLKIYKDIFKVVKKEKKEIVILAPISSGGFAGEFAKKTIKKPTNYDNNYITSITPDIILQAINEVYIGNIHKIPYVDLYIDDNIDYPILKKECPYYSFINRNGIVEKTMREKEVEVVEGTGEGTGVGVGVGEGVGEGTGVGEGVGEGTGKGTEVVEGEGTGEGVGEGVGEAAQDEEERKRKVIEANDTAAMLRKLVEEAAAATGERIGREEGREKRILEEVKRATLTSSIPGAV